MGSIASSLVAGGAMSAGSSILNNAIGIRQNNYNVHAQEEENQRNRDFQSVQAEIARQYNTSERVASQDFAKQMIDYQNAYNDPSAQAQRLRAAGLNPNIAMGNSNVQSVSASVSPSSPASSPMPSPASGISPVSQPVELGVPNIAHGISSMLTGIANARKAGVETSYLEKSMNLMLRKLTAESSYSEAMAAGQELANYVQEHVKDHRILQAIEEARKTTFEALNASSMGKVIENQAALFKAQEQLQKALEKFHGKNSELIQLDISTYFQRLNSILKLQSAQASESSSHSELNTQSAERERIFNKIYNDRRYQHSIISQAVTAGQQAISQKALTDSQVKHLNYMIEQAAYANDMKEFTYWSDQIQSYLGSVGEAASAFYGAGALRELVKMRQLSRMPVTSVKGFKQ